MDQEKGVELRFPDPNNIMSSEIIITPQDGMYKGGRFVFTMNIPDDYPFSPPKVHCQTRVLHPVCYTQSKQKSVETTSNTQVGKQNIDLEGHVCLNILRENWSAVLNISAVTYGLMYLFVVPNADDPLNKEAAEFMRTRPEEFERMVRTTMHGGYFYGVHFPRLI